MNKLETSPLSEKYLEELAKTIAKFFAPYEDAEPSAKTPRRISPEIAERLEIEVKSLKDSKIAEQKTSSNDECLREIEGLMAKYFDKHKIPTETIAAFPGEKCLDELVSVISDFFIEYKIPPETVESIEIALKYQSATQQGIMAFSVGCVPGGPPYAPCNFGKTLGIKR